MNSPANQPSPFLDVILAVAEKVFKKDSASMLLARHVFNLAAGALIAHGIVADTTSNIFIGVIMLAVSVLWSWIVRAMHIDEVKAQAFIGGLTHSDMFKTLVAALASQGVTALSAYYAVDANNPTLLLAAILNGVLSKLNVHQRLLGLKTPEALNLFLFFLFSASLVSCSTFKEDAKRDAAYIGLGAADAALFVAQMQLAASANNLMMAQSNGESARAVLMKQLALSAAQKALEAAKQAVAKERVKLDKQPRNVVPLISKSF